jgi:hypothetical protein
MRNKALAGALAAALVSLGAPPVRALSNQESLLEAVQVYESGDLAGAARTFYELSENAGEPEVQFRAEFYLALALGRMGLPHSALTYDRLIIDQGPNHPYYLKAVENTLEVMDAVGDKSIIPSMLDREYNDAFANLPKAAIDRVNFLVSLWSYNQKKWDDAASFVESVPVSSPIYARARYLTALELARKAALPGVEEPMAAYDEAAKAFEGVLALGKGAVKYDGLADLKVLAQLGLGRVRYAQAGLVYGAGGESRPAFEAAVDAYGKVPRFARYWRDALFEGAYAAFMGEDPGRALGLLQNLHAPVAGEQLVPESWLLKAHVYYQLCLFEESKSALQKLTDTYGTLRTELEAIAALEKDPDFFFELLQKGSVDGTRMPPTLRNELLVDETLRGRRSYILALEKELSKLRGIEPFKGSGLLPVLVEAVEKQRALNVQVAGKTVLRNLSQVKAQLEDLESQADIVRFEMAKREKDQLENSYDVEAKLSSQPLYRPSTPPKGVEYWDFEGEFWPDELGFYRFTVKNACPATETASTP